LARIVYIRGMGEPVLIARGSDRYPPALSNRLGDAAPASIAALGNPDILRSKTVALFCSRSCPGLLASQAYDVAQHLRDAGATVAGGFHAPMEVECLKVLLASPHPVLIAMGRSLQGARIPGLYRRALAEGRLLLLSCFAPDITRVTRDTARVRNMFLAALADRVFVAHAGPGSQTEKFCRAVMQWGGLLYTLDDPGNAGIISVGAQPVTPGNARALLVDSGSRPGRAG
jgi:predicted Rossmann fold nucleotide-binding protein DprA/Smf involved in DNA uptake